MDKYTRVRNFFENKPVDRVPASFWFHFVGDKTRGRKWAEAHDRYRRETGVDFLKVMSDGYEYPLFQDIEKASDWAKLRPLGRKNYFIKYQVERDKILTELLKGEIFTFYNIFSPFTFVGRAIQNDALVMSHLRENPKAFKQGLDAVAEDLAELARLLITEGGSSGIYLAVQGGEKSRFSLAEYQDLIRPSELKVLTAANEVSKYNLIHLCGYSKGKTDLSYWADYQAGAYNWSIESTGVSLKEGKTFFHGKPVIGGFPNFEDGVLYSGTKERIQAFARKIVAEAGSEGIGVGADCSVPYDIDWNHIRWVLEALEGN